MNREIKFRGKRTDNGEWVYGSLIDYRDGECAITIQHHVPTYVSVDPETVGQFTGLTDKNGVEIYEGDILRGGIYDRYKVKWDWEENGWNVRFAAKFFQVIGNIHE